MNYHTDFFRVDWWLSVELSYPPEFCLDFLSPPKCRHDIHQWSYFHCGTTLCGHLFLPWFSELILMFICYSFSASSNAPWSTLTWREIPTVWAMTSVRSASTPGCVGCRRSVSARKVSVFKGIIDNCPEYYFALRLPGLSFVICDWLGMVGEKFCVKYEFKVNGANNDGLSALLRHQFANLFWNISTASRLKLEIDTIVNVLW